MLDRVRPYCRASTSAETPMPEAPVDLGLGVVVQRRQPRPGKSPDRGDRGRRLSSVSRTVSVERDILRAILRAISTRPACPGRTSAMRRARRIISSRSASVSCRNREPRSTCPRWAVTNRCKLDSRNPTLVRPPITNRRATNPCRRHRVTVRGDTLYRRLTSSTVKTGSSTCSTACRAVAERSSTNSRRSC